MKAIAVVILLACLAGGGYYAYTLSAGPELPAAQPVDPPADAEYVADFFGAETPPHVVIKTAREDPSTIGAMVGLWLSDRGWDGEILGVQETQTGTRLSLQADHISVPGQIAVICNVPGAVDVEKGGWAKVRGSIADIVMSTDVLLVPHKVVLADVTVLASRPAP
ncbi:MAG: hypothetical protein ACF8R7_07795 [Phycisphaerales bacterium JB039]